MKSEYYLFQGEFKNQPEAAKEDGEKDEEGGDTFVKAVCFLWFLMAIAGDIVVDGDGDILEMT